MCGAIQEDGAGVENDKPIRTRCRPGQQIQRQRRSDEHIEPEHAQADALACAVERVGFDLEHRAGDGDTGMRRHARIDLLVETSAERAMTLAQLEVGLAVHGAHRGAELTERGFIDQVHRERQRNTQHHREPGAQVAPNVVAPLGHGQLVQPAQRFHVSGAPGRAR